MGRFRKAIKRRCYKVPGPNSIWHLDSYHKLIRWGIIIHGGIDGFSRLPVYLMVASNNKAITVLNCFLEAITMYGLPSRIRCDKGGENSLISQYMMAHPARGPGRRSCITGKSVHNRETYIVDAFATFINYSPCLNKLIISTQMIPLILNFYPSSLISFTKCGVITR